MDDREWAAKWVGLVYGDDGTVGDEKNEYGVILGFPYSDAELADAVRAKVMDTLSLGASSTQTLSDHVIEGLAFVLMTEGPIAFIAAVREVVDGR